MSLERITARAAIAFAMVFSAATLSANPAWADDRVPNKAALAFVKQQQVGSTLELMGVAPKLVQMQGAVGQEMQSLSMPLLRDYVSKALTSALAQNK